MKRLLTILLLALLLCGCAADSRYLEYTASAFEATVEGRIGELDFTAEVRVGAPRDPKAENPPPRDIEMTFLSPATLAGIRIARRDGRVSVTSGELVADGRYAADWLAAADLLVPVGRITGTVKVVEGDVKMTRVEIRTGDLGLLTLWTDRSGYPLRIRSLSNGANIDISIRTFMPKQ